MRCQQIPCRTGSTLLQASRGWEATIDGRRHGHPLPLAPSVMDGFSTVLGRACELSIAARATWRVGTTQLRIDAADFSD